MRRAVAAIALALLTAACGGGDDGPATGTVVDRAYHPEQDTTIIQQVCVSYGKYGCQTYTPMVIPIHDDAYWEVKLKNGDRVGWRTVDAETYARCELETWCDTNG